VVWVSRSPSQTQTQTQTPTLTQTQTVPPAAAIVPPPTQPTPPPKPELEEVIVDSVPPGAQIIVDGAPLGDTPEALKVEKGKTQRVLLHKDGFVDQEQTVDPQKTHKLLVRLEHIKKVAATAKGGKPAKLPTPPPATLDPPPKAPPPPVAVQPAKQTPPPAQPPKKKKVVDPYERVDEAPKKTNDVLNPY
jgi:serine/threonine-protein kinase